MKASFFVIVVVFLASSANLVCVADSAESDSMRLCTTEKNDARRLACYDRAIGRASVSLAPEFGPRARSALPAAEAPVNMIARVLEIQTRSGGLLLFKLDNAQTWIQQRSVGYFPIKQGDTVTISRETLGSYVMVGSDTGHRSIAVQRVK